MNRRIASALAFSCSVAAATLAAAAMSGSARADDITIDNTPFVSQRSRADVRAETLAHRAELSSAGMELASQQNGPLPTSGLTREQVRADYRAAREEVWANNSEAGGSMGRPATPAVRMMTTTMAAPPAR